MRLSRLSLLCGVIGFVCALCACGQTPDPEYGRTIVLPEMEVQDTKWDGRGTVWRRAEFGGGELLTDVPTRDARRFAIQFAQFLSFLRAVCPELLLPEGTRLTVVLASAEEYDRLIPLRPAPNGRMERPWSMLLRAPDAAVLAVRFADAKLVGRPADRVAITSAQCAYVADPRFLRTSVVYAAGLARELCFHDAVGESRALFQRPAQSALKQSVLRVMTVMASALDDTVTYHDLAHRWRLYFPDCPGGPATVPATALLTQIPQVLPSLAPVFTLEPTSPAWANPLHRLQRDVFVHWCLLAGDRQRGRALMEYLSRADDAPMSEAVFQRTFGLSFAAAEAELIRYLDVTRSSLKRPLPAVTFWDTLPYHDPAVPTKLALTAAPGVDVARIKADLFNALGQPGRAGPVLVPWFKRSQPSDPDLLLSAGVFLERSGDRVNAMRAFQEAIHRGSRRPYAFVALARGQWAALTTEKLDGPISREQSASVVALLHAARGYAPALRETYLLLCDVWERRAEPLAREELAALAETLTYFRYDEDLASRCAAVCAKLGHPNEAAWWLPEGAPTAASAPTTVVSTTAKNTADGREELAPMLEEPMRAGKSPGNFAIAGLGLEMIWVPPGRFVMGAPAALAGRLASEGPLTEVEFQSGYWLGRTEITRAQWSALMATSVEMQRDAECPLAPPLPPWPSRRGTEEQVAELRARQRLPIHGNGSEVPMDYVSWEEAAEFCRRLTEREHRAGRLPAGFVYALPTEAQWERACRAGRAGMWSRGELEELGWLPTVVFQRWGATFAADSHVPVLQPVAMKRANAWGFHDMVGNVSEWCRDWYADRLPGGSVLEPCGPERGVYRVVRGGGRWGVEPGVRAADSFVRSRELPTVRFGRGFRVALVHRATFAGKPVL